MPNKGFWANRIKNFFDIKNKEQTVLLLHLPNKNHLTNGLIEIFCKKNKKTKSNSIL
jgi:hypothetical protein